MNDFIDLKSIIFVVFYQPYFKTRAHGLVLAPYVFQEKYVD